MLVMWQQTEYCKYDGLCMDSYMAYTLHDRTGTLASLLYKAEKPSVYPSVHTFLATSISAMAAWINVRLTRRDSYVFWHDKVYF